ncbi:hypothetical protein C2S52_007262 [Perilla frutescens var. hirtella]|nr:hypothetical protein C2S52_007262 [Perilla frutescens var. hirtella]
MEYDTSEIGVFTRFCHSNEKPRIMDLLKRFNDGVVDANHDDYLKVANILVLYYFALGYDDHRVMESFAWVLVDNLDEWNRFPWGNAAVKINLNALPRLARWLMCTPKIDDFHGFLDEEHECQETLALEDDEDERDYWISTQGSNPLGVRFPAPFNLKKSLTGEGPSRPRSESQKIKKQAPQRAPEPESQHDSEEHEREDARESRREKGKRTRETRSSSSSGRSDHHRSRRDRHQGLVSKLKKALLPDILVAMKREFVPGLKDALLLDIKEYIKSLWHGSKQSRSQRSRSNEGPPSEHDQEECSQPSRRSLHGVCFGPGVVFEEVQTSPPIMSCSSKGKQVEESFALVESRSKEATLAAYKDWRKGPKSSQVYHHKSDFPLSQQFFERIESMKCDMTAQGVDMFLDSMRNQLEKGDSLLHAVTAENTRIMDTGFFISLQTEWRSGRFDKPDSPRRHRGQEDYYWWEPPFALLATVLGKDRDRGRSWWNAKNVRI